MPRSIVVTSAASDEGKTARACNIAVIASHAGKRAALVDADLRRPTVADVISVPQSLGLSDVVSGRTGLDDLLQSFQGQRLTVLPSGPLPKAPSELASAC